MTLTQMEYIVAVDTYKNFVTAADRCFVTQPTLSMQLKKLEEHLGVVLFDRSKHPVIATDIGKEIIEQARVVLSESLKIKEIVTNQSKEIKGILKIGIIPTVAPYLLPLFLNKILKKYPNLKLIVEELVTDQLLDKLRHDQIDCGILATPPAQHHFISIPLYYEPFVVYASKTSTIAKKKVVTPADIDLEEMWILNEGHCMRLQVENLCFGNKINDDQRKFEYHSGTVETLKKIVEGNGGFTILPELGIKDFSAKQMNMVRYFHAPEPAREISLLTHRNENKKRIIQAVKMEITDSLPDKMIKDSGKKIMEM